MNGFRILIVEDIEPTRELLVSLFQDAFPDSLILAVESISEAREALKKAMDEGRPFDLAIPDFRLPEIPGGNPEVDESLCALIQKTMPEIAVVHITGFKGDPKIEAHLGRVHPERGLRPRCFDKKAARWSTDLLDWSVRYLYSDRIDRAITDLFGSRAPVMPEPDAALRRSFGKPTGTSIRLALLMEDIRDHWGKFDEKAKNRIRTQFEVDDQVTPIKVTLK